jgi:hypothetical protein
MLLPRNSIYKYNLQKREGGLGKEPSQKKQNLKLVKRSLFLWKLSTIQEWISSQKYNYQETNIY